MKKFFKILLLVIVIAFLVVTAKLYYEHKNYIKNSLSFKNAKNLKGIARFNLPIQTKYDAVSFLVNSTDIVNQIENYENYFEERNIPIENWNVYTEVTDFPSEKQIWFVRFSSKYIIPSIVCRYLITNDGKIIESRNCHQSK